MPMIVNTFDELLYERKRDIFLLEIKPDRSKGERIFGDFGTDEVRAVIKHHTDWLDAHGIKYARCVPPSILVGWVGHIHTEFSGHDDPVLKLYSDEFEIDGTRSKEPDKYQLVYIIYDDWVSSGRMAEHEQYLIDREDPDWCP